MIVAVSAAVALVVTGASLRVAEVSESIREQMSRERERAEVAARILGAIEQERMQMTMTERIEANRRWDRAYNVREAEARAATLVDVLAGLDGAATVRDLLTHVGESGYDLDHEPPPVHLGELLGRGEIGPTVLDLLTELGVETCDDPLRAMESAERWAELDRSLASYLESEVAA